VATKKTRLAKKYARMLITTLGLQEADQTIMKLQILVTSIQEQRPLKNFFMSPSVTVEELIKGVEAISQKLELSEGLKKFLTHLAKKRLVDILEDVLRFYTQMYYEQSNKAKAVVTTVVPVNGAVAERLKASLERITGRKVELEFRQDPDLLGGIMVQVGSTMYDNSLRGQLRLLKEELIKG